MFEIKNVVEKELSCFIKNLDKTYGLSNISPLLVKSIKEFVLREGKRIRPVLFVLGYRGFCDKKPSGFYASTLSTELLHDFMLVHDDIIDKSDTRRGKPSMHKRLNNYLANYRGIKFNGQDLAIVIGDVMYAMGLNAFLEIKEDPRRKEAGMKQLIKAALYTGCGEFAELLYGIKDIAKISKEDIYKIYDYKTAYYTFSSPLAIGAILAGAPKEESDKLIHYGIYLGRAFQIKDDILGMFGDEKEIGKSTLTDLQEAKKTILIWYAYKNSKQQNKAIIRKILGKKNANIRDLATMRRAIEQSGSLDFARREVLRCAKDAETILNSSKMKTRYKTCLREYSGTILKV